MIKGIGIDLIEFTRFSKVSEDFFNQIFTSSEMESIQKNTTFAGLKFSVKEAILKALGIGLYFGFFFKNIELKNNGEVCVNEPLPKIFSDDKRYIHIGAGNSKRYACGIAIIEEKQEVD